MVVRELKSSSLTSNVIQKFKSRIDHLEKLKLHHITVTDKALRIMPDDMNKSIYNQRFIITLKNLVTWQGGMYWVRIYPDKIFIFVFN